MKAFRLLLLGFLGASACSDSHDHFEHDAEPVVENYAAIVYASYSDSLSTAETLKKTVADLVASPSEATLKAAQDAWLNAREPYGQTEVYRFYSGPIDNAENGPEGQINAWPLDELYIDYVQGNSTSGLINDTSVTLSKELLLDKNEQGSEKNIATGYHAIEFLLWGQDLSTTGAGARPYTDYVNGGTAANQTRRGEYLNLTADILVDDLTFVTEQWAPNVANYAADFQNMSAKEAIGRILGGMGSLAGAELSGERMMVAYDMRDQEDEHSCFSDNTHRDLYNNALAIQNVYLGRYGTIDGPGLDELVRSRDAVLDAKMRAQLDASVAAVKAIPVPFDQAIQSDEGREKILTAVRALQAETETIVEIAALFNIKLVLE